MRRAHEVRRLMELAALAWIAIARRFVGTFFRKGIWTTAAIVPLVVAVVRPGNEAADCGNPGSGGTALRGIDSCRLHIVMDGLPVSFRKPE
ncbi:MAG: hypothetical protein A2Z40_01590 [Deltaproteobacteria bacterium RBG_19FT_COMBO_60_16]|nr:MAG: hypothetical protein A2Z40_01590 [Deltaproteobacteria bacterium RBG_19FT_COMBO_60_16]